jgi:ABC-type Mn2+/Zn2+ transport system ATPase subunit
MDGSGTPPIEALNLTAGYNGEVVLDAVSFRLEPGHRVAVVGPNGAGKTTLFKVIAGILPPMSGSIIVHGHEPGEHICVAYVPQRSEVDWRFPVSVADVVMMGRIRELGLLRWPTAADWGKVGKALEDVGMEPLADRQIGELSGGQQQRVFLAQASAQNPEIVLLDEPFSGLDVPSQRSIFRILDEFQGRRITVLVATHDLNLARDQFDEVILLNRRLVGMGKGPEVLTRDKLVEAYAGGVHVVEGEEGTAILADSHLEGRE